MARRKSMTAAGILLAVFGGWLAVCGLAWAFQRRLVYFPSRAPLQPAGTFLPGAHDVDLRTEDALTLHAWFVPGQAAPGGASILVFNGNAGDRSHRVPLAEALSRAGYPVLLFDYRGYGGNPGSPDERGLAADARAARRYLVERSETDPSRIVYLGESLGAAVAVGLAAEQPPVALVLRSPFTSLAEVGAYHYPYLPVGALLRDRFDSIGRIPRVTCPLLVIAGERDGVVPLAMSRRLLEAAGGARELVVLPGADHNDRDLLAGDRMVDAIRTFLTRHSSD